MAEHESSLAVLIDYENMARPGGRGRNFDVRLVLNRLSDKGRVIVKRAYADWSRYRDARHDLQNLGLGLIEMPSAQEGAKNRADIQMAVDAMELAYSREHVSHFAIVSGDSDFTPLVGKLRELNKRVLGVGLRNATSELLVANCDEFIYYESLTTAARRAATESHDPLELLRETLQALAREGSETPLASHVNDTMKRKDPAFDYGSLGFGTLSKFLEEMASEGVVKLEKDPRSGTYRVSLADGSAPAKASRRTESRGGESSSPSPPRRRRRRRRGSGRGSDADGDAGTPDADGSDEQADEDAAEIFEHVVGDSQAPADSDLPPVDEPISYEDMIMLTPDIDGETELIEASDAPEPDADAPPTRSARRRRRRGATADPEPTGADLAELSEEPAAGPSSAEAEAPAAPDTAEPAAEAASTAPESAEDADGEDASSGRRRRRRTTPVPTPPPAPEPPAASEADEKRAAEDASPSEPVVDPVAAAAEATSTRRRVPRKSSTQDDDAQAEEKPKRRRTTRAKKAETDGSEAAEAEATEEKPKRRRTTRAKKAETEGAEAAEGEEKPKRRRTTRAKKAETEGAGAAEAEATEEKPQRRRTTRAKKAETEDAASE